MVTFILCLIGAIARETFNAVKMSKMDIKKLLISIIVASFLLCAIIDYVEIPFSVYTIVCIVCGIWSQSILKLIMHTKFMTLILGRILKKIKEPIIEEIADVIEELEENDKKDCDNNKDNKLDSSEKEDDSKDKDNKNVEKT